MKESDDLIKSQRSVAEAIMHEEYQEIQVCEFAELFNEIFWDECKNGVFARRNSVVADLGVGLVGNDHPIRVVLPT